MSTATESTPVEHLRRLLQKFHTAMLVTHTPEGELRGRPMAIAEIEDDCRLWFFSGSTCGKVEEIKDDSQVSIICQREESIYLSISGIATVNRERTKINALWKESFRTYFPKGKDDPDIALIHVVPEDGEYWDNEGFNKIKYIFQAAKAYATGTVPAIEEGQQHAKVAL